MVRSPLVSALLLMLLVGVAGWLLGSYVSGALAAIVVLVGVVAALVIAFRGRL